MRSVASGRQAGPGRLLRLLACGGLLVAAALAGVVWAPERVSALLVPGPPVVDRPPPAPIRRTRPLLHDGLPLREACRAAGMAYPPRSPVLTVRKAERVLELSTGGRAVKEYRIALGFDPGPDKEREGDGRTPLGEFYVCTRLPRSRFHRFLGISYPGPEAAARGLERGRITRAERDAILSAHRARRQPPWGTRLGGAVGIHGGGAAADWTLGCIALENADLDELFPHLSHGTRVRIGP